jgi:DNA-binding transcriptional MerR regulator
MSATETREVGLLTIGAVCDRLKEEFPDISISKIRYLEGEGLVTPKRTQGGYRLFSEDDVERLQTILRLQRDEFLPLRVIREELAAARPNDRRRKRSRALDDAEPELGLDELCAAAGIDSQLARELEEFGLLKPRIQAGERLYADVDVDVARACGQLAGYGIAPRHLRQFATAVGREVALLETFAAPTLRARNPQRRKQALADFQRLAELTQELAQRLFWRDARRLVS